MVLEKAANWLARSLKKQADKERPSRMNTPQLRDLTADLSWLLLARYHAI